MPSDAQGRADHRAVEVYERLAGVARDNGRTVHQCERLITACVINDAAIRWFARRGYDMTEGVERAD